MTQNTMTILDENDLQSSDISMDDLLIETHCLPVSRSQALEYSSFLLTQLSEILGILNENFDFYSLTTTLAEWFPHLVDLADEEVSVCGHGVYQFSSDPCLYPVMTVTSRKHKTLKIYIYPLEAVVFQLNDQFKAFILD